MKTIQPSQQQVPISAIVVTMAGVFLFATKAIIVKLGYREGMNASTMLLLRMGFALPFFAAILFWGEGRNRLMHLSGKDHLQIILLGVVGYYLSSWLDFEGLQYITANLERLILFSYPTLVVILSALFLKKPIKLSQVIAIVLTYLGMFITFYEHMVIAPTRSTLIGGLFVFGSSLTYAIYLVGSSELLKREGVVFYTAYSMVVSTACVFIHSLFADIVPFDQIPGKVYVYGLVMAVFSTFLPSFLIAQSLKKIGASNMSVIGSIGPIFTIVLSYFLLQESLSTYHVVGGMVILIGVYWVSSGKK